MKKIVDIIVVVIVGASVFTLTSYTNIFGEFYISNAAYLTAFFLSGLIIHSYYNRKYVVVTFCAVIFTLLISIFVIVKDFLPINILQAISVCLAFSLGYLWMNWKPVKKVGSVLVLIGFYLLGTLYIVPHYKYSLISKVQDEYLNKQAGSFFKNVSLKDTTGTFINDFLGEDKVTLVDFYFRNCMPCRLKEKALERLRVEIPDTSFRIVYVQNGNLDEFGTYLRTCREHKNTDNRFYDVGGTLASNLNIQGFPFELVIDKKGIIRQTSSGFASEASGLYVNKKKSFITGLLNE